MHVRHRVRLGEPTHDLTFDDHWIDAHTAVVDGNHTQHVPHSGLRVDFDCRDVAGERPGEVGRVVIRVVLQAGLHAVGHVAVRSHRALLNGHSTVLGSAHIEPAEFPLDVLVGYLEQVGGNFACLRADLPADHRDRCPCDRRGPRCIGTHAERCGVGVTFFDHDVLSGDAEFVCNDLGPCGLMALALGFRARPQNCFASHVDPQLGGVEHLDAENVVLTAVAGAKRFGHRRDADPEQPPALLGLFFLRKEVLIADCFEAHVETLLVLP